MFEDIRSQIAKIRGEQQKAVTAAVATAAARPTAARTTAKNFPRVAKTFPGGRWMEIAPNSFVMEGAE